MSIRRCAPGRYEAVLCICFAPALRLLSAAPAPGSEAARDGPDHAGGLGCLQDGRSQHQPSGRFLSRGERPGGSRDRLAAEEGARAREAARTRTGAQAPPRAGHGRSLARPWSRRGREQPASGCACGAAHARCRRDRVARRGSYTHRGHRRRSVRARSRRRSPPRDTGGVPHFGRAVHRRATTREPLRRLGGNTPQRARDAGSRAPG